MNCVYFGHFSSQWPPCNFWFGFQEKLLSNWKPSVIEAIESIALNFITQTLAVCCIELICSWCKQKFLTAEVFNSEWKIFLLYWNLPWPIWITHAQELSNSFQKIKELSNIMLNCGPLFWFSNLSITSIKITCWILLLACWSYCWRAIEHIISFENLEVCYSELGPDKPFDF